MEQVVPQMNASEMLVRRQIAVFNILPSNWAVVETDTVGNFLAEDVSELGSVAHFQLFVQEYGCDGFAFLLRPDQDARGLEARVSFIVPDSEAVDGPERPTKSGSGVLKLVISK